MATRNGSAVWRGDLKSGSGTVEVGEGVFEGNYSFSSRFEEGEGTNPEELIAAAHASCFAMALSLVLSEADHPPDSIRAQARVHL
ncbi:MAG TPA: OsmC family peroxiredoxin, partial [Solirubrobacterales bacterium]|nr:OsmC family peroxiredoxin [Solirubrobacterales bacterium]